MVTKSKDKPATKAPRRTIEEIHAESELDVARNVENFFEALFDLSANKGSSAENKKCAERALIYSRAVLTDFFVDIHRIANALDRIASKT